MTNYSKTLLLLHSFFFPFLSDVNPVGVVDVAVYSGLQVGDHVRVQVAYEEKKKLDRCLSSRDFSWDTLPSHRRSR